SIAVARGATISRAKRSIDCWNDCWSAVSSRCIFGVDYASQPMIGQLISHYRVIAELGSGGMGVVYLAEDTGLNRKVALKFLKPDSLQSADAEARLIREARAASALD